MIHFCRATHTTPTLLTDGQDTLQDRKRHKGRDLHQSLHELLLQLEDQDGIQIDQIKTLLVVKVKLTLPALRRRIEDQYTGILTLKSRPMLTLCQ